MLRVVDVTGDNNIYQILRIDGMLKVGDVTVAELQLSYTVIGWDEERLWCNRRGITIILQIDWMEGRGMTIILRHDWMECRLSEMLRVDDTEGGE